MTDELVTIATFRFLPEAQASKLRLEADGLTVLLANAEIVSMDWFLANAIGNIKLQVPQSQAAAATAVLEQARNERRRREKQPQGVETNTCLACGATMREDASRCPACGWSYAGSEDAEPGATVERGDDDDNHRPLPSIGM